MLKLDIGEKMASRIALSLLKAVGIQGASQERLVRESIVHDVVVVPTLKVILNILNILNLESCPHAIEGLRRRSSPALCRLVTTLKGYGM